MHYCVNEELKLLRIVNAPYYSDYEELDRVNDVSYYLMEPVRQGACSNPVELGYKEVSIVKLHPFVYKYDRTKQSINTDNTQINSDKSEC